MDFALLPPEVNSGRMYAGPGTAPMFAASAASSSLATELHITATAYESAVTELEVGWRGSSSAAMATAATSYAAWMHTTAVRAEQAAAQSKAVAAAYEAAFAATVPPPMITANRSLLGTLIATNFLGQNIPAIAAVEAHYAQMWAQDAVAMYNYAGSAAAAAPLTPFTEPPTTVEPASQTAAAEPPAELPSALQNLATALSHLTGPYSPIGHAGIPGGWFLTGTGILGVSQNIPSVAGLLGPPKAITGVLGSLTGGRLAAPALAPAGLGGGAVSGSASGSMGRAGLIGGLSVPPTWTAAAPAGSHRRHRPAWQRSHYGAAGHRRGPGRAARQPVGAVESGWSRDRRHRRAVRQHHEHSHHRCHRAVEPPHRAGTRRRRCGHHHRHPAQRVTPAISDPGGTMSFLTTQPELLTAVAANLASIGSAMSAQNTAAAEPTTSLLPAAADEVSALTALQFATHAQLYQSVSAQATAIHQLFVQTLSAGADSYSVAEAANAAAAG